MADLDLLQRKIKSFADTVNAFKTEAVQVRVIEALLRHLGVGEDEPSEAVRSTSKRGPRKRRATKRRELATDGGNAQPKPARKVSSSPGAFAAISDLLSAGFFKSAKTIRDITDHCRTTKGHRYKANECSPALLRLMRNGKLKRKKNKDGQYEYSQS